MHVYELCIGFNVGREEEAWTVVIPSDLYSLAACISDDRFMKLRAGAWPCGYSD